MAVAAPAIAAASLALAAVGTGVSVYGAIQAGKTQQQQAEYQKAVMHNNEILAERAAQDAEKRGQIAEQQARTRTRQLAGRQRAVLANNGVLLDTGTALDVIGDTYQIGEQEALTIRNNAQREALGYRQQGANFNAASQISAPGYGLGVAGTALGGLGSVASKWYQFDQAGAFDFGGGSGFNGGYGAPSYSGGFGNLPTSVNTGMISGGI